MRNAAIWEVIGGSIGGGVDPRTISAEAKEELHGALSEILSGLIGKAKQGYVVAAALAAQVATQRAAFR